MSENKKLVVFFSIVSAVCLGFTYFFSIAKFSARCISSDFLVVVFGGLFGSFGVMLLSEIKKYCLNKRTAEDSIHFMLRQLYFELIVEIKSADAYLSRPDAPVPDNVFSCQAPHIRAYLNALEGIDYSPFKQNGLSKQWDAYKRTELPKTGLHVINGYAILTIALKNETLKALDSGTLHYLPTSADHDVNITLQKIKTFASEQTNVIDQIEKAMSEMRKGRYHWDEEKQIIQAPQVGLPTENPEINAFFHD